MNSSKINVAIIGAGQLGSRHLQGILKSDISFSVFVVDLNNDSLETARKRSLEIDHTHSLQFLNKISDLPDELNFVVIATNADVRAMVTTELINLKQVQNLLLEKVLFQKLEDYDKVQTLLAKKNVATWVNHPRRLQHIYQDLKLELKNQKSLNFVFYGQNWGLACNGLHMLDIISYLTNSEIKHVTHSEIDHEILESKRAGNIEITGVINGETKSDATFSIQSVNSPVEGPKPISVSVFTPNKRFFIQEGAESYLVSSSVENKFTPIIKKYSLLYQSDLSKSIVDSVLTNNNCNLPTLEEATSTHKLFIKTVLDFYNQQTNQNIKTCPIT